MAAIKSINFLPEIFKSDANRKFLAATVDQLISEPDFKRIDGYIGRKFAPNYRAGDKYVEEPSADRQNYQLEPSLIVQDTDATKSVLFYSNYVDLLQKIKYYGGLTNDHSRLFQGESYNFNGMFDFDKFVNFNQYYWLPDGPPEVAVSANSNISVLDFIVVRDSTRQAYTITGYGGDVNPIVTLVKGTTYTFRLNQLGYPFWIQTAPGATGSRSSAAEVQIRSVFGVANNGDDFGTITFNVPASTAQDTARLAERVAEVDYATTLTYAQVQNHLLSIIKKSGGIDGSSSVALNGRTVIFLTPTVEHDDWTDKGVFDFDLFDQDPEYLYPFEAGSLLDPALRYGIFRIRILNDSLIRFESLQEVDIGKKVYIKGGNKNAGVEYLKNSEGFWELIRPITAPLTELYYQDGVSNEFAGSFKLVEPGAAQINVTIEIIGKKNYTSLNGVKFTNGLKIRFDNTVTPVAYTNNVYIVEGVGKSIRLVSIGNLVVPEEYALADQLSTPDYLTVSRGSQDLNAWSRSNRWFHSELINLAAGYNNDPTILETVATRGSRPIIEFEPDLYLYNYGQRAKAPVDILDYTVTDAFNQVEGQESYVIQLPNNITRPLTAGTRIIFAGDTDTNVKNKIYKVEFITIAERTQIHLVSQNTELLPTYYVSDVQLVENVQVVFAGGNPDIPATANVTVDSVTGTITDITFENFGSGYRGTPTATFVGGGNGAGAQIDLTVNSGIISAFTLVNGGTGYSTSPAYNFVPQITFASPVPSIGATQAVGTAIMSPTTVANVVVDYSGINYIADPSVNIETSNTEEAQVDAIFSKYKYVDYIRVVDGGTAVGTSPTLIISSPNSLEATTTYANTATFTSNVVDLVNNSGLSNGLLVYAAGVTGGTTIGTVAGNNKIVLSNRANITNGGKYVFKSAGAAGVTLTETYANTIVFTDSNVRVQGTVGISVGWNVYGEGIPRGTTVAGINTDGVTLQLSNSAVLRNGRTLVAKPDSTTTATVTETSRFSTVVTVDTTAVASQDMYITGGVAPTNIASINLGNPVIITTDSSHNLENGDKIVIRGVLASAESELNGGIYWVGVTNRLTLVLYSDPALQNTLDGRNYSPYVSGGYVAGFTIEYGVTVTKVLSETQLELSSEVSLLAGTTLAFVGKTATAIPVSTGTTIYAVNITEHGSGYLTPPSLSFTYSGGTAPVATALLNDDVLDYFKIVNPGAGYQIENSLVSTIISTVVATISDDTLYDTRLLTFASADDIFYVKPGWIALLVLEENQNTRYTDFSRVPYVSTGVTGPDPDNFLNYMDVELTNATVLKVQSIDENIITLDGDIISLDADGEPIPLVAGSKILFTAKSRFFTEEYYATSDPIGESKTTYLVRTPVTDSKTIFLNSIEGIQFGMSVRDLAGNLPSGLRVLSIDIVNQAIVLSQRINSVAGIPLLFSTEGSVTANLNSAKLLKVQIEDAGSEYTSAPTITIEPAIPSVEKVTSSTGTDLIQVDDLDGIVIGMTVTSEYGIDGSGVTTGAIVPRVIGTSIVQIGTATFEYFVQLNQVQPVFQGLIANFSLSAKALAKIESLNVVQTVTDDPTPDTYEADDTVLIALPTIGQSAIKQRQVGVNTYNQYWFDGTNWIPSQQKEDYNQAPLFDIFDLAGYSATDTSVYVGSKFFGTKLFSYKTGTGPTDPKLGFSLSYKNFQNVGDIEFVNNYDTETFQYLSNKLELSKDVNTMYLKQQTSSGFRYRNIWTKFAEPTKQYQIITHEFDGLTNYFEIDVLPAESKTIPYVKIYVDNAITDPTQYEIVKHGGRYAVIIDGSLLSIDPISKVDILIYSKSSSSIGHYQLPANLDQNAENLNFESLTLGQLRQHLITMSTSHYGMTGNVLGTNNLRDLNIKPWQGAVVQHASPVMYSSLFLGDNGLEFIEAIEYAQKEYTKFKNKFIDQGIKADIDPRDIPLAVDTLMRLINVGKNTSMPWYDSDMIPYGTAAITTIIPIVDVRLRRYQLPNAFDDTVLSRRSVLVYLEDSTTPRVKTQLVKGIDFTFNADLSAIDITSTVNLTYTSQLRIIDRPTTVGCYVPETPTKLGLHPRYIPRMFVDDTYQTPILVIQGHDGSITPAFNDIRDQLLLELELRIYNNIKVDYQVTLLDIIDSVPGKFRSINYSLSEFNQLLSKNFLKWASIGQVNYSANTTFESNNAWTWNYKNLKDFTGEFVPGFWRGIYQYFYDTDKPHVTPWEMLGFYEKPSWWEENYGPAPYTGANTVLWDDLELGLITGGPRLGIDTRFARPGLSRVIPVDEFGMLKSPEKVLLSRFDSTRLSSSWAIGDAGPAESAWRKSSHYPYALQIAIALSRPGFYFGTLFDISLYKRNTEVDQLLLVTDNQRVRKTTVRISDDGVNSGTTTFTAGYVNWVRDWFSSKAIDGTAKIKKLIQSLEVKLSYKMAGYSDSKFLNVLADQSSPASGSSNIIIPQENYKIFLNKSAPLSRIVYSAVIIERTTTGFSVAGYDLENPYFTIIPSEVNGSFYSITAINDTAVIYRDFQPIKLTVPYGFEFSSRQQVVDFLVSYGRYLTGQGMVFDTFSPELEVKQDWTLSAREFLTWAQQGWKAGNLVILSPVYNSIKIINTDGVIDSVENILSGSKILDQNFVKIKNSQFSVVRDENTFSLTSVFGQTIALADLNLIQYEHVLLLDNVTVFNDIVYQPALNNRQYRLRLIGNKVGSWTGQLNPAGFIYNSDSVDVWKMQTNYKKGTLINFKENYYYASSDVPASIDFDFSYWTPIEKSRIKTGLLPNFAYNAEKFNDIYDLDHRPVDLQLNKLSQGITGFRDRAYFQDFKLDVTSQAKFYQGFIKQKGTASAIDALTTATFENLTSSITLYEEWGMRVGEYGALGSNQSIEFQLDETQFTSDPSTVVLITRGETPTEGVINVNPLDLYRTSEDKFNQYPIQTRLDVRTRPGDAVTAGYPRVDDVDDTIFDLAEYQNYSSLVTDIGSGFKLWVAKDFNKNWNVYRATETNVLINELQIGLDSQITINVDRPHGLMPDDLTIIKNFANGQFDGFYRVLSVPTAISFVVQGYKNVASLRSQQSITGSGILLLMISVRYSRINELVSTVPLHGWRDKDRVWIDNDIANDVWAVFEKNNGWDFDRVLPVRQGDWRVNEGYGGALKISRDNSLILAAAKNSSSGSISGLRIIHPGFLYDAAEDTFSLPLTDGGSMATVDIDEISRTLLYTRVTNSGSGYTHQPNVTVSDTSTLVTTYTGNVYNSSTLTLTTLSESNTKTALLDAYPTRANIILGNINDIWIGDTVTGSDGQGNSIPGTTLVANINYNTNMVTLTNSFQWNITSNPSLTFTRSKVQVGDIVTAADNVGNVVGVELTTITTISTSTNQITLNRNVYLNGGTTINLSRGTGGNVQARLAPTSVTSITVVDSGAGFTVAPQIEFIGGGGRGATAQVTLSSEGAILSVAITNSGIGYTSAPDAELITTNIGSTAKLRVNLAPSTVEFLYIGASGTDYKKPKLTITTYTGTSGSGATGNVNVTNKSIGSVIIRNYGVGYTTKPNIVITDSVGVGSGAVFEALYQSGQVKTFQPGENNLITQVQNVPVFGPDAAEFGYEIDIGLRYAFIGAPGTLNAKGAVEIASSTGSAWVPQQVLSPTTLAFGDRFGHSVVISKDERWLYVGAPGAGKVFAYVRKTTPENRRKLTVGQNQTSYVTDLYTVKQNIEIKVVGESGRVFEPSFDYNILAGIITFKNFGIISSERFLFVSQLYPATVITSPPRANDSIDPYTIQGVLVTTYELVAPPREDEQMIVQGSDGRVFILGIDYTIAGKTLTFLNTEFTEQASIVVQILEKYYVLSGVIEPDDQTIWEDGVSASEYNRIAIAGEVNTYADLAGGGFITGDLIKVLNLQVDGSYNSYEMYLKTASSYALKGTENRSITRGVGQFGSSLATTSDCYQLIVGAPEYTATDTGELKSGKVYIFDRLYTVFTGTGGNSTVFNTLQSLQIGTKVTINGIEVIENVDYTANGTAIEFVTAPANGARIQVDVNAFNIVQSIESPSAIFKGYYGATVAISPDNKNIFVGAPGYRDVDYYNGRVYRYINQALAYGKITATISRPQTISSDTIRINDVEVLLQASGNVTTKIAKDINGKNITGISSRTDGVSSVIFDDTQSFIRGSGYYTSNVAAVIDPPDQTIGNQAYANVVTLFGNGAVESVTITATGAGYTFAPNIRFTGANTIQPTATVEIESSPLTIFTTDFARAKTINILPGIGSGLADIGLEIYVPTQIFQHPDLGVPEKYGSLIKVDPESGETLMVGSEGAATLKTATFDALETLFDRDTTRFIDVLKGSGAVYVYDYLPVTGETLDEPSQYLYNQVLQNSNILFGDNFGSGFSINNNWVVVGANASDYYDTNAGLVHLFKNMSGKKGWTKLRNRTDVVDIDYINKVFLYDKNTQLIDTALDYFDPVKGKILGAADQDIDYKTAYDPAVYNKGNSSTVTIDSSTPWNEVQLGRVWWNLDVCRYINYEQGELTYRVNYWGQLFPDSTIEVLEWVESLVLPSQYAATNDGEAKYNDNSAYVEIVYLDTQSGLFKTKYYYWVKNKVGVDTVKTRRARSISALQNLIEYPAQQDIPYLAVVSPNAFSIYNVNTLITSTDKILKIEYATTLNEIIAHSEYELIQQGNALSVIPAKLINKLIDSLSGENSAGEVVPDLRLKDNQRLGIGIRPRQSMIADVPTAVKIFVGYINRFLQSELVVRLYDISGLSTYEALPSDAGGFYNQAVDTLDELFYILTESLLVGYKVLIKTDSANEGFWTIYEYQPDNTQTDSVWVLNRIQSHDSTRYWKYADWYVTGYNINTQITYIVPEFKDIAALDITAGDVIKVLDDGQGNFELYAVDANFVPIIAGVENGTIQLLSSLYDQDEALVGFDNTGFDNTGFAKTAAIELRNIINGLFNGVFVGLNEVEINKVFFVLVNYILSEQASVDWILKTSFISIVHKIRKLLQFPSYIKDQQDYFESYINEVKPYRTQIRSYLLDYEGTDIVSTAASDFDLPAFYDSTIGSYRALNIGNPADLEFINFTSAKSWLDNYKYSIQSITVIDGGSGYVGIPRVTIAGGGGTGAIVTAEINAQTGKVIAVVVDTPGSGYTYQPTVTFSGGGGDVVSAKAYVNFVQLSGNVSINTQNKLVRSINTTLKFDRTAYLSVVKRWKQYTTYHPGDIIAVPDVTQSYFTNYPDQLISNYTNAYRIVKTVLAAETLSLNIFNDSTIVTKLSGSDIPNALDRVALYNRPGSPDIAVLYSSPDTQRLDSVSINDQVSSSGNEWNKVIHSIVVPSVHEYQYLAIGNRALIAISQDSVNWTIVPLTEPQINLRDAVLYNGTTWVAVGNQGTLLTSVDTATWTKEIVNEYRSSPSADNELGTLQQNVSQAIDFTSVEYAKSTRGDYLIAVGNGSNILVNPYDTSADIDQGWYSARPQPGIFGSPIQFLSVITKSFNDLTDIDGTNYLSTLELSGYFTTITVIKSASWGSVTGSTTLTITAPVQSVAGAVFVGSVFYNSNLPTAVDSVVTDIVNDGTTYTFEIEFSLAQTVTAKTGQTINLSTVDTGLTLQQGFVIAGGVNGNFYITSYARIDDLLQGYSKRYNYDLGKKDDENYPWVPMNAPAAVAGSGDNASGEQISGIAMSNFYDRWIVAVGSGGSLIWNRLDSPLQVRAGSVELSGDTDSRTVIDYGIEVFKNFREFNVADFEYPLTKEILAKINFTDVSWDGEKFVAVGDRSTVIWGYPGNQDEAYIELGNLNPILIATTRTASASWTGGSNITTLLVTVATSAISGPVLPGMTMSSTDLPVDSLVTMVRTYNNTLDYYEITIEFTTATVATRSTQNIAMSYVFTDDIPVGTELTFDGPSNQTVTLTTSRAASAGDTRIYVEGFNSVSANWRISGIGIPPDARVRLVGKFAQFNWKYAQGSGRDVTIDYNSTSVNTTTLRLDTPFTANIPSGTLLTFFDSTGTRIQIETSQFLNKDTNTLAFANARTVSTGYSIEANTTLGIVGGTRVSGALTYTIAGVLDHLKKDIPDLVPGTSYNGVKVTGQPYTETRDDILSLDTAISSDYDDTGLGVRPEDIIVEGGKYIDSYSSHAPQELIPGQVIDSLQMNVFTANIVGGNVDYGNVIAYKIFTDYKAPTAYYRLPFANTTVLTANLAYDATEIEVDNINTLPDPNPVQNQPGSIWVNGEKINYFGRDTGRGVLTDIRRGAARTSIPMQHDAGSIITDASPAQLIGTDTVLPITSDLSVDNGFAGSANVAIYRSVVVSEITQGSTWLERS